LYSREAEAGIRIDSKLYYEYSPTITTIVRIAEVFRGAAT